jgi:phytoene dehydrogenase-like protein
MAVTQSLSKATKPFKQIVDKMFELPLLRAFFYGFPSYGGQTYHSVSPGSFLIPYYMLKRGVYFPVGGVRAIPLAFHRLAEELGVKFQFNCEAVSFLVEGDRVVSTTDQHGEVHRAESFAVNFDRSTFASRMGEPITALPSYSYFTMHLGISREISGLDHHNLFVPADFEQGFRELYDSNNFPSSPIVYLNACGGEDPAAAPTGKTNLFAVVTSPSKVPGVDWAAKTDEYRRRVRSVLSSFGVSWTDQELDLERVQTPLYFESTHGNFGGSLYGLEEKERLWGMFPATNTDKRWRNVAFCGGSVQPGAGLPMVTLSGKFAIDALNQSGR